MSRSTSISIGSKTRTESKSMRWDLCFALWALQGSFLYGGSVTAFQSLLYSRNGLAPATTSDCNLRTPTTLLFQARPEVEDHPISSFQQRLLDRMNTSAKSTKAQSPSARRHIETYGMQEVQTLKDFKRVVIDETPEDQFVVVWFYSPWCRSCKGVSKGVQALSREYKDSVKFVQVPVLSENASLHQGLGVKSVPFVHLYHPTAGLVEERKLTRKYLPGFHRLLRDYQNGSCLLGQTRSSDNDDGTTFSWSTESPYEPSPKAKDVEHVTVLKEEL